MRKRLPVAIALVMLSFSAFAIGKKEVKAIIEEAYPGAKITEIDREKYKGQKVYEVDFKHDGKKLEAVISLDGEIIKVGIDD
ncbi:MAG: PepSY domain-containing protein [Gammaproteobacteria bacterium]|nr:PepSY domain-containing protein [Gammaproteobacteria bacterium]